MGLFDLGVDWSEVEAPAFDNVPAGIYEATLTGIEPHENDAGKKAFIFDYLVTEDEGNDGRYVGRTVKEFQNYTDNSGQVTENGLKYLKARLENLGVPPGYDINKLDPDDIIGAEVAVTITKRTSDRGTFFNVTRVELLSGGTPAEAKSTKPDTTKTAPTEDDDDDNPFG